MVLGPDLELLKKYGVSSLGVSRLMMGSFQSWSGQIWIVDFGSVIKEECLKTIRCGSHYFRSGSAILRRTDVGIGVRESRGRSFGKEGSGFILLPTGFEIFFFRLVMRSVQSCWSQVYIHGVQI